MWQHVKEIFDFSRGEKNGIMVLILVLIIAFSLPYVSSIFIDNKVVTDKEFEQQIADFKQSLKKIDKPEYQNKLNRYIIARYDSIELFNFNPNKASKEQFKQLGLTNKQINTLLNYRNKGGKFYKKDDFRKIYGIRHKQYQILKPYILLPDKQGSKKSKKTEEKTVSEPLFTFNPNTVSIEELQQLGLSEKQAQIVDKYRKKGGFFKRKQDFKKIYVISESLYRKLEPYIVITKEDKPVEKQKSEILIDLNSAGVDELVKIKGIGKFTAQIIIKYRKKLGGFVNVEQLREIKKLNKENFEKYKHQLRINTSNIRKISMNFAGLKELVAHPYIKYSQAKKMVEYRTKNGAYTSINQLLDNKILKQNHFNKIKPYLKLN